MVAVRTALQRPGVELNGLTVNVYFPDGLRPVPAHIELPESSIRSMRPSNMGVEMSKIVPDDDDEWEFREQVGGAWYAVRSRR